jgi:hypothetical protein
MEGEKVVGGECSALLFKRQVIRADLLDLSES